MDAFMNNEFSEKYYNGYTHLPNQIHKLLADRKINSSEYILLIHILSFKNFKTHDTSINQISQMTSLSRNTISSTLKKLEKKNFIRIKTTADPRYIVIEFLLEVVTTIKNVDEPEFEINVDTVKHAQNVSSNMLKTEQVTCSKLSTLELNKELNKEINKETCIQVDSKESTNVSIPFSNVKKEKKKKEYPLEFETIYQEYPKKIGKYEGYLIYQKEIKTPEDHVKLKESISKYRIMKQGTELNYIKTFNMFMLIWEEIYDYDIKITHCEPSQKEKEKIKHAENERIRILLEGEQS
jgi:DNA-binding MarR family transcriptional regulator